MKTSLCLLLVLALPAHADERYDHKGAVGLLLGLTGEYKAAATIKGGGDEGWRFGTEVGATVAVGSDGNELKGSLRALFGGIEAGCSLEGSCAPLDLALFLGYRSYFDLGQWKTFFDLDLAQHVVPRFDPSSARTQIYTIGPRVAVGVQLDFLPVAGSFLLLEGQIGFGDGLRYGAALMLGFQLRSYLLE
ncbi:MAG: hypothetical protein H6Q89_4721 [Myxococcaceae bacterium]|nr:hypothetical protein [Myxococcaceae bacterium]